MTVALYPAIITTNKTLSPDHAGSNVDTLCQEIHDATKGWGANKQKVINALATQDASTRYYMNIRYKELFDKELDAVMKKEFSGDFGLALKFLSLPSDKAEAAMLRKGMSGIGAAVKIVWSIMVGRTNTEMEILKKTYFDKYNKDLGKVLASELHGDMERYVDCLFVVCCSIQTRNSYHCFVLHCIPKKIDFHMLSGIGRDI